MLDEIVVVRNWMAVDPKSGLRRSCATNRLREKRRLEVKLCTAVLHTAMVVGDESRHRRVKQKPPTFASRTWHALPSEIGRNITVRIFGGNL